MSEANVVFKLDGIELTIQCSIEDKMRDICQQYSTKIDKNMNTLLFLYGGDKVNFESSFKDQASFLDRDSHEMTILVDKIESGIFNCPKCGEKININTEKLDEIILFNDEIKETINGITLQIENIIKTSSTKGLNIQLRNINKMLNMVKEVIKSNIDKIKNLFDNFIIINKTNNNIITKSNPIQKDSDHGNVQLLKNGKLLEYIQSIDIAKKHFSHLNEKIKLKTIKYNKKWYRMSKYPWGVLSIMDASMDKFYYKN